jgi:hypothetical protein
MLKHAEDIEKIRPLTRADIKKLREGDTLSFHRSPTHSGITARLRKLTSSTDQVVWEHEVSAFSTLKWSGLDADNGDAGRKPLPEVAVCHVYESSANNIHSEWRTIASLLKVGDRLELIWYRDAARNEYMKKHHLHGDRLQIVIHRKGRDGKFKPLLFLVESQCCENNTARMIRRGPYNSD